MSSIKLPYHPEIEAQVHVTRFGVSEITTPLVYETPINNKVIVRADLLESLRPLWGDSAVHARNTTYSIVSGNCDEQLLNERLSSYYRKYSKVTEYINGIYSKGSKHLPLWEQVLNAVRSEIEDYTALVNKAMDYCSAKYLVTTHLYVYYALIPTMQVPDLGGIKVIC